MHLSGICYLHNSEIHLHLIQLALAELVAAGAAPVGEDMQQGLPFAGLLHINGRLEYPARMRRPHHGVLLLYKYRLLHKSASARAS